MNKQDIIKRLTNIQLDSHERESLLQLLHYMNVEGVTNTSSNNKPKPKYTKKKHTSSNSYNNSSSSKKHTSSKKNTR